MVDKTASALAEMSRVLCLWGGAMFIFPRKKYLLLNFMDCGLFTGGAWSLSAAALMSGHDKGEKPMFSTATRDLLYGGPQNGRFTDITNWIRDLRDATVDEFVDGQDSLVKLARVVSREGEG
jgi:hypothetical protein